MLTIGSLCSGIDGLGLGLERSGVGNVVWQVEKSAFCRRVLARHWPDARRYDDVRVLDADALQSVGLVCFGFPCRNLSHANHGTRTGLAGDDSGLWHDCLRVVAGLRPRWVVVENVHDAWRSWVPTVRSALGQLGYASVSLLLRACDVGAPFERARVFVVAQSYGEGESARAVHAQMAHLPALAKPLRQDWGTPSPRALGAPHGIPDLVERCRAVGNAVMPAMAECIGRAILQTMEAP